MVLSKAREQENTIATINTEETVVNMGVISMLTLSGIIGILSLTALTVALVNVGPVALLYGVVGLL